MQLNHKHLRKRLKRKILMQMLFGLGGAIVILGALFKILYIEIGPITGGLMLGFGLVIEAIVFAVAGLNFTEVKEEHREYIRKLKGQVPQTESTNGSLAKKIDALMHEAKLDVKLVSKLTNSIKNLEHSAETLLPASAAAASYEAYSEQLTKSAEQMEALNTIYAAHVKAAEGNSKFNDQVAKDAEQLRIQMERLSKNLEALNRVYSNMLEVMKKK